MWPLLRNEYLSNESNIALCKNMLLSLLLCSSENWAYQEKPKNKLNAIGVGTLELFGIKQEMIT